jgi:hypothetical protein
MRWHVRLSLLMLVTGAFVVPAAAGESAAEVRLKAGFVANFLQFTTWSDSPARITACGLGPGRAGDTLDHLAKVAKALPEVSIRRLRSQEGLAGCHVLFLGEEQSQALPGILSAASASRLPLLVVTDFESGAPLGATISLVATGGGRQGFDVNLTAARNAGLVMSTRLLQLARRVY